MAKFGTRIMCMISVHILSKMMRPTDGDDDADALMMPSYVAHRCLMFTQQRKSEVLLERVEAVERENITISS